MPSYARLRPTTGNVGTRLETGDVILYDAGSYYAHNEMELGIWRCQWGQFFRADVYSMNYRRNYKAAEPLDEWDDRNRLYSLKYNLNYSGGHPGNVTRQTYVTLSLFGESVFCPAN